MNESLDSPAAGPIHVERWPSEMPLFVLVILGAIAVWCLLAVTIIGGIYALFLGLFFFFTHLAFVAHLRGSAIRLGPEQFPELHARVRELAARAGIETIPDAYVLQAGGALNAVATKLFRSRFIVLYSDLLEACGEDREARDMIIGHELGHIRYGHLDWMWFLLPGFLIPFLGSACSRAREYSCDRFGFALCGQPRGALAGLAVLAAGKEHAPRVNLRAFALQREQMNTGWMTLGKWLATHPPLCDRVGALEPELTSGMRRSARGTIFASAGVLAFVLIWVGFIGYFAAKRLPEIRKSMAAARAQRSAGALPAGDASAEDPAAAQRAVTQDLKALADAAENFRKTTGKYPADAEELYLAWRTVRRAAEPMDPYTGERYHYEPNGDQFLLWSSGPDGRNGTADDVHFFGGAKAVP